MAFWFAVLLIISVVACSAPQGDRRDTVPQVAAAPAVLPLPSTPQADWRTFRGTGFSFRTPTPVTTRAGAAHPNQQAGTILEGLSRGDSTGRVGPSWRLVVVTYPNTGNRVLAAWVDSVRQARNAASAEDPDSLAWLVPPDTLTLGGGTLALRLQPFCGDCEAYEVYTTAPGQIIMFGILYDISILGDHEQQRRLYDAILSTYQTETGQPPRPSA